ncbi:hypothetical protein C9374_013936 [Naegleria lovaniensis]|uniref:Ankyrin repeat domain-containing protein n=1 Tax=Naegleria lovaniensis TaxID=51637 RepID=A0AA88H0E2_NAELO|nr:uncharacterized protein C9374_013936 [Naegleria lovaniensis]KAG2389376.1 hypothetical protein C9374_013936 [Naegleria lovaniensis]
MGITNPRFVNDNLSLSEEKDIEHAFTCIFNNDLEGLQQILQNLSDASLVNETFRSETLLYRATSVGNLEMVQLLLKEKDIQVDKRNVNETPLSRAVILQNVEIAKLLLQHGADANVIGTLPFNSNDECLSCLGSAIHYNNRELFDLLVSYGANYENENGVEEFMLKQDISRKYLKGLYNSKRIVKTLFSSRTLSELFPADVQVCHSL